VQPTEGEGTVRTLAFKLALAGDYGVGKTSLVRRFVSDTFSDDYIATLGAKVSSKQFQVADPLRPGARREVRTTVWDIMGQRGVLDLLSDAFFLHAGGVLYIADATRPHTLHSLAEWSKVVTSVAGDIPGIILVNKMDLGPQVRTTEAEIEAFCREQGWTWFPTSAKTGAGVPEAFVRISELYLKELAEAEGQTPRQRT
jgi:hypothetical protein